MLSFFQMSDFGDDVVVDIVDKQRPHLSQLLAQITQILSTQRRGMNLTPCTITNNIILCEKPKGIITSLSTYSRFFRQHELLKYPSIFLLERNTIWIEDEGVGLSLQEVYERFAKDVGGRGGFRREHCAYGTLSRHGFIVKQNVTSSTPLSTHTPTISTPTTQTDADRDEPVKKPDLKKNPFNINKFHLTSNQIHQLLSLPTPHTPRKLNGDFSSTHMNSRKEKIVQEVKCVDLDDVVFEDDGMLGMGIYSLGGEAVFLRVGEGPGDISHLI